MTRSTVIANQNQYTVSPLSPRAQGHVFQAVVSAQLIDGLTGAPVESARVSTGFPGLQSRTARSGFVGLAGDPSRALPGLATTTYDVDVLIEAPGYLPRQEVAAFATDPAFPAAFAPADFGTVVLRRLPVVLHVRSYELGPSNRPVPLPGADVTVEGYWTSVAGIGAAAATTPLLGVAPGLSARRPGGAVIDRPTLTPAAEPARTLDAAAAAGATRIAVSNTGSLVPGNLVGLDLGDPERAERIEVLAVHGPADALSPAEFELRFPLAVGHAEGASAVRIPVPAGPAPAVNLTAEALAGDRTLAVGSLAGLAAGQAVRISGGSAAAEYRIAELYETTTDADGFARLPAFTGLAALTLSAVSAGLDATARVSLTQPSPAVNLTLT
ncbi:hypothetical protein A5724_19315 [Mycobacterium sp. ACS1612]|uniref:hypothetical protein n=1 Tax=Mycobacterium sp. ACS1612 TaxID=1834117 RepID=UPI0007FC0BDD|nr:hypothetical protein [Mycobacterium sp. ACS1612]OBF33701.1 hypothetical protein A5724_19315 [Mycobacterium sp. ACS1612]